jgi:hypothetical protein
LSEGAPREVGDHLFEPYRGSAKTHGAAAGRVRLWSRAIGDRRERAATRRDGKVQFLDRYSSHFPY